MKESIKKSCVNCGNDYCRKETVEKGLVDEKNARYIAQHCVGYSTSSKALDEECSRKKLLRELRNEKTAIIINSILMSATIPVGLNNTFVHENVPSTLIGLSLLAFGSVGLKGLVDSIDEYSDTKCELNTLKRKL